MGHWRRIKKDGITIIFGEIWSSFKSPIIIFLVFFASLIYYKLINIFLSREFSSN